MRKDGLLCWKCHKVVPYSVVHRRRVRTIGGKDYEYQEKYGVCDICGEEITVPGLIDEHVHLNYKNDNIGANADLLCTPMGVTTAVDPGSTGWANFDGLFYNNIIRCKSNIYAYLHVAPYGIAALAGIGASHSPGVPMR